MSEAKNQFEDSVRVQRVRRRAAVLRAAVVEVPARSVGGSKEVHYGYFSSVRTPEYRSGWEDLGREKIDTR